MTPLFDLSGRTAVVTGAPRGIGLAMAGALAGPVVFLAAPASDYVNGVILPVDGGWLGC